jgi:hypothetical protein
LNAHSASLNTHSASLNTHSASPHHLPVKS